MATEEELATMADWLAKNGWVNHCNAQRRLVSMTYLRTVLGDCSSPQLREVCRELMKRKGQPLRWLALRQMATN